LTILEMVYVQPSGTPILTMVTQLLVLPPGAEKLGYLSVNSFPSVEAPTAEPDGQPLPFAVTSSMVKFDDAEAGSSAPAAFDADKVNNDATTPAMNNILNTAIPFLLSATERDDTVRRPCNAPGAKTTTATVQQTKGAGCSLDGLFIDVSRPKKIYR
jgi:hypothetical protein